MCESDSARMPVPKFVCEVACAPGFASYMDDDVPWDTRSYVRKARPNSIALEKLNLGTHMRATDLILVADSVVAPPIGLEPMTDWLTASRSTWLSYGGPNLTFTSFHFCSDI